MRVDVESVIMKIFNYFSIYTVRTEALKEFCDYVEINYQPLLNHSKTRWLSLFPAVEVEVISCSQIIFFIPKSTALHTEDIF